MQKNGSGTLEGRIDSLKESVRNVIDAGGEKAGQFKERAIDAKDTAFAEGKAAIDKLGALIKAHPFAALGIAFSVGYVAIRMMRK